MKARPHLGLATAVVVLILVSCGSGAEPKGPSQTDVWADLSRRVAREGSSADLALEAFSLAFGSLPGVDVPATSGPSLRSGSGAVRLVLRHFQEFSPEQQRAIEERLIPPGLSPDRGSGGSALAAGPFLAAAGLGARGLQAQATVPDVAIDQDLTREARQIAAEIGTAVGHTLSQPVFVAGGVLPEDPDDPEKKKILFGWAEPVRRVDRRGRVFAFQSSDVPMDSCLITLTLANELGYWDDKGRFYPSSPRLIRSTLAHEVFHCHQYAMVGIEAVWRMPSWLIEGTAEWAGEAFVGGGPRRGPGTGQPTWRMTIASSIGPMTRSGSGPRSMRPGLHVRRCGRCWTTSSWRGLHRGGEASRKQ